MQHEWASIKYTPGDASVVDGELQFVPNRLMTRIAYGCMICSEPISLEIIGTPCAGMDDADLRSLLMP